MPMLDERASESSVQPLHRFAFDQRIGSFAPCVPYGGSAVESGTIAPSGRARGGLSPKTVRRIREYIDGHIGQRIRVELLAKLANLPVSCALWLWSLFRLCPACRLLAIPAVQRDYSPTSPLDHPSSCGWTARIFYLSFFYVLVDLQVLLRWLERPYLLVFPAIGTVATFLLAAVLYGDRDLCCCVRNARHSFSPHVIPFAVTIAAAAIPLSGLASKFWTGVLAFPLIITLALRKYVVFGAESGRILSKKRSTVPPYRGEGE